MAIISFFSMIAFCGCSSDSGDKVSAKDQAATRSHYAIIEERYTNGRMLTV